MEKKRENAQVLVILALVMLALLGFMALAIDGSVAFADRRLSQNAADAAALAGAEKVASLMESKKITDIEFKCLDLTTDESLVVPSVTNRGEKQSIDTALDNGFTIDRVNSVTDLKAAKNGVVAVCSQTGAYVDVHVMITHTTPTGFMQLFYPGGIKNTVYAIARVQPHATLGGGNGLTALNEQDCQGQGGANDSGIKFNGGGGDAEVVVESGIHSNSCIVADGGVSVTSPSIEYMDYTMDDCNPDVSTTCPCDPNVDLNCNPTWDPNGSSGEINVPPAWTNVPVPRRTIDEPTCGPARGSHNGGGTILPGTYDSIRLNGAQDLTLTHGLYCIRGNITVNGTSFTANAVTFYFIPGGSQPDAFTITAGTKITMSAPDEATANADGSLAGMLIYMDDSVQRDIKIEGNSETLFTGTVYAPYGVVEIGGNVKVNGGNVNTNPAICETTPDAPECTTNFTAEIVANRVVIGGGGTLNLFYDSSKFYLLPTVMELNK